MKNKHPKRIKAKRMMTNSEREKGVSPFDCVAWNKRSDPIKSKLSKKANDRSRTIKNKNR